MKTRAPTAGKSTELRLPAIRIRQGRNRELFAFAVDGKLICSFATVSRIQRGTDGGLNGYQRPEALAHIAEIRTYLETENPLLPNAVVLAFDQRVRFVPASPNISERLGALIIPIDPTEPDHLRPGFIVDGQQRIAAIRESRVRSFEVCATAFIAGSIREQTEQFILVNSTKPLPKGLIHELLPATQALLPITLERKRLPAALVTRLNEDRLSPLYRQIRTATNPEGRIKDNSLIRFIDNSLSEGALYGLRVSARDRDPSESMFRLLCEYFHAVGQVFPEAWALPPKHSRLTHGAGIAALGFLMDAIAHKATAHSLPSRARFVRGLQHVRDDCHWTGGFWTFAPDVVRRWDQVQNTPKDIDLLCNHLAALYRRTRRRPC